MSVGGELLIGVVMVVGLVGVIVPVLPGLLLIWGAGLAWVLLDGGGAGRWVIFAMMTALVVAGTALKYAVPARSATNMGAPRRTLALGALGAVAGFFLIPVLGFVIGGLAGIFGAEWHRLGDTAAAWRSTRSVLVGVGIGVVIELVAGVLMVATWAGGAFLT